MRAWTWRALVMAGVVTIVAACGDDGGRTAVSTVPGTTASTAAGASATASTTATTTATTTTATPATTASSTSAPATASTTIASTTIASTTIASTTVPAGLPDAVQAWLSMAQRFDELARPAMEEAFTNTAERSGDLERTGTAFWSLVAALPAGMVPQAEAAAEAVVFALGQSVAPAVSAWGVDDGTFAADWRTAVDAGRAAFATAVPALVTAATGTEVQPPAPDSQAAARHAVFTGLIVGRGLGHQNFMTRPDWSVVWIGGPPTGTKPEEILSGMSCAMADDGTPRTPAGTGFAGPSGTCGVIFYSATSAARAQAIVAAWLKDPGSGPDGGEAVFVRRNGDKWDVLGSVE